MNSSEYKDKHQIFYIVYILLNIMTFGSLWLTTNLIGYGVSKANDKK